VLAINMIGQHVVSSSQQELAMTALQRCVWLGVTLAFVLGSSSVVTPTAEAHSRYKTVFEKVCSEISTKNFKVDCGVCHPTKDKAVLNAFGQALKEELGEKNCQDEKKIAEALRKIVKKKCNCGEWSERIEQGKYPCEEKPENQSRSFSIERLLRQDSPSK